MHGHMLQWSGNRTHAHAEPNSRALTWLCQANSPGRGIGRPARAATHAILAGLLLLNLLATGIMVAAMVVLLPAGLFAAVLAVVLLIKGGILLVQTFGGF